MGFIDPGDLVRLGGSRRRQTLELSTTILLGVTTSGIYDSGVLVKLCIGGVLGATLGALLCSRIPSRTLQVVLSFCLVDVRLQLCWKAFG
jgi:uncharacterized membrane protein YfcA